MTMPKFRDIKLKSKIFICIFFAVMLLSVISEVTNSGETGHSGDPISSHISDSRTIKIPFYSFDLPQFEPVTIGGLSLDFSPTKHLVLFWAAAILLMLFIGFFYNRKEVVQKNFIANVLEDMVIFIRDSIVKQSFPHDYEKYTPYFLTFFFLILFNNYLGLIPMMSTATGNLSITAGLALFAFIVQNILSVYKKGIGGYFRQFMPVSGMGRGGDILMNSFMFPIEVFSMFVKPIALSVRLYANMLAGHTMVLSIWFMAYNFKEKHWILSTAIPLSFLSVAMNMLELLVCFIQAYVFTILTAVFLSSAINDEH